jgi:hypothetical protein
MADAEKHRLIDWMFQRESVRVTVAVTGTKVPLVKRSILKTAGARHSGRRPAKKNSRNHSDLTPFIRKHKSKAVNLRRRIIVLIVLQKNLETIRL